MSQAGSSALRIERHRLIFLGLVALDEVTEQCRRNPYPRSFALRATLAMLYAFSDGTRGPYDDFWRECGAADRGPDQAAARRWRKDKVRGAYRQICDTLGVAETEAFIADVRAARHAPNEQARHLALTRSMLSEDVAARQRLAEMLRTGVRERNEAREYMRRARG